MTLLSGRPPARRGLVTLGCLVTVVVLSGCANVLQGGGGSGTTQQPGAARFDHATGAEDPLVSIASGGGFVAAEYNLRNTPEFLLLGDGTAVVPAAMIESYPGPAINPLQSSPLDEGQIQELFTAAHDAGLLAGEIDFGQPAVSDMATTTLTLTVNGQTVTQSAYALGFSEDTSSGLTRDQIDARAALRGFIDAAHALVDSASALYEPSGVVAYRLVADAVAPGDGPEQAPQTWPIRSAPAPPSGADSVATCLVLTGEDAATLLGALANANELTPWLIGTDPPAHMVFRPYLPADPGCEK